MPSRAQRLIILASMTLVVAACATPAAITRTYTDDAYRNASFGNFLVIGVAGDYNSRAQFERSVASGLKSQGALASPYYSVVKGNEPMSREAVIGAVQSGNFDAVLVTRVVSQATAAAKEAGTAAAKASTVGGSPVNFFRYNYVELNEPESISYKSDVTLASELFSAADEKMIWAIEVSTEGAPNAGVLIDNAAASIVGRLAKDRLISR